MWEDIGEQLVHIKVIWRFVAREGVYFGGERATYKGLSDLERVFGFDKHTGQSAFNLSWVNSDVNFNTLWIVFLNSIELMCYCFSSEQRPLSMTKLLVRSRSAFFIDQVQSHKIKNLIVCFSCYQIFIICCSIRMSI